MKERIEGANYTVEFGSFGEFHSYIESTPFNSVYRNPGDRESIHGSRKFAGTASYEEATDLLRNGWDYMAKELNKKLEAKTKGMSMGTRNKMVYDIAGYQASVPRYLQGIPTSMINSKKVPVKQKVVTINKSIAYRCGTTTEEILEESVKALQIIKKIESQGTKVNLNVVIGVTSGLYKKPGSNFNFGEGKKFVIKVRVKSANERLNVAKLAFCLVNPSMYRRIGFRFFEVYEHTPLSFQYTYGYPIMDTRGLNEFCKNEYILPPLFNKSVESLTDIEEFRA